MAALRSFQFALPIPEMTDEAEAGPLMSVRGRRSSSPPPPPRAIGLDEEAEPADERWGKDSQSESHRKSVLTPFLRYEKRCRTSRRWATPVAAWNLAVIFTFPPSRLPRPRALSRPHRRVGLSPGSP